MQIKLNKGFILIDDEDNNFFNKYKWQIDNNNFVTRKDKKNGNKTIFLHKLIMGNPKGMQVDHINHNRLDNRKINLRICTHQQNNWNKGLTKSNKTGIKGVHFVKRNDCVLTKAWRAQIRVGISRIDLGYFKTKEEAKKEYDRWAKILFGEFAYLNN